MALVTIGALWKNEDKNGKTYLSGRINDDLKIYIFKNGPSRNPNAPQYTIYEAADHGSRSKPKSEGYKKEEPEDVPF